MLRLFYAALVLAAGLELTSIPGLTGRTAVMGLAGLSAIVLPVSVALFSWSRSKT